MIINLLLFTVGLIMLVGGAEGLVRGATRVARALGVGPFLVGFTIVTFGTTAPEQVVSISAALRGNADLALGNVVGSNIVNVGLVLGAAAVVAPFTAHLRLLRVETPLVVLVSVLLWLLCSDGTLSRLDGAMLLCGFTGLVVYMYRSARSEPPEVKAEVGKEAAVKMPVWQAAVVMSAGLAILIGGAQLMVYAAVEIARALGVSEWLIGLTVVAVGTSLPELAAAVVGAFRGESDLVLGNVVGSCLFNILMILGLTSVIEPMTVPPAALAVDLRVMLGFAVALLLIVANGLRVYRWEGIVLLVGYGSFIAWQVQEAN
ncbi:MAG: calcium/sodium antiporter [Gemmataceae bacterium]|nr:calcium/sodium antiporter [Gemmata sp.]MDW8196742.1 calcium/sodium antiporter [Gemmataceae bacterium]